MQCAHLAERNMLVKVQDPVAGELVYPANPINYSVMEKLPLTPAPRLGEHTVDVLKSLLGYEDQHIAKLRDKGYI